VDRDPRTFAIIGAALEVHRELGHGFLEAVYQEAFARELSRRGVPFRAEVEIPIFKASGHSVGLLLNLGAWSLEHRRLVMSLRESAESFD
jgi:PD-(D/E)XK nuclease superfamily protein